jgi:hypothetical protein
MKEITGGPPAPKPGGERESEAPRIGSWGPPVVLLLGTALELLVMLIQCHRQVSLSFLSSVFPQPIQYRSRKRNLQRFLVLPQLSIRLLWFPLFKYWLRQEESGIGLNRAQRRHRKKLTFRKFGYWLVAIDRTEWKGRNVFMVSLVWGTHALPLDWEVLDHVGNSDLRTQKRLLTAILPLFKRAKLLVLALGTPKK